MHHKKKQQTGVLVGRCATTCAPATLLHWGDRKRLERAIIIKVDLGYHRRCRFGGDGCLAGIEFVPIVSSNHTPPLLAHYSTSQRRGSCFSFFHGNFWTIEAEGGCWSTHKKSRNNKLRKQILYDKCTLWGSLVFLAWRGNGSRSTLGTRRCTTRDSLPLFR